MPFEKSETERIVQLYNMIEGNKAHDFAAPTYRDSPYLREMTDIVLRRLNAEKDDAETLEDAAAVLRYLTESYDRMGRAGMSAKLYLPLLEAHTRLSGIKPCGEDETAEFEECFYRAQKARRRCFTDDCADLREAVSGAIPEERIDELSRAAEETCRSSIKHDSVEMTEEYLAVIDEVEAEIVSEDLKLKFEVKSKDSAEFESVEYAGIEISADMLKNFWELYGSEIFGGSDDWEDDLQYWEDGYDDDWDSDWYDDSDEEDDGDYDWNNDQNNDSEKYL